MGTLPKHDTVTVIICDDHPAFAQGLARVLEAECEELSVVGVATSGEEAQRLVQQLLPELVVMDIYMPELSGIEATREICALSPSTKVVMLTASDSGDDLYEALRAGALGYVTKDTQASEITDVLMSVHRNNYSFPAALADQLLEDLEKADATLHLDDEEREILGAIGRGATNREIATQMNLSERTVRRRLHNIYDKLHLADRIEAAIYASQHGLAPKRDRRS
jgi:NarL family two-component system response regulator LiaR